MQFTQRSDIAAFVSLGGRTTIDCSIDGLGRNLPGLREASEVTGWHQYHRWHRCLYSRRSPDWVHEKSVEELAEMMIADITEGLAGVDAVTSASSALRALPSARSIL